MTASNLISVVDYSQDADSFGWHIVALFNTHYTESKRRWGVLSVLAGTDAGEGVAAKCGDGREAPRTREEVISDHMHLVDRCADENEARRMFEEAKSRQW